MFYDVYVVRSMRKTSYDMCVYTYIYIIYNIYIYIYACIIFSIYLTLARKITIKSKPQKQLFNKKKIKKNKKKMLIKGNGRLKICIAADKLIHIN